MHVVVLRLVVLVAALLFGCSGVGIKRRIAEADAAEAAAAANAASSSVDPRATAPPPDDINELRSRIKRIERADSLEQRQADAELGGVGRPTSRYYKRLKRE